jgi:hypothetical protein
MQANPRLAGIVSPARMPSKRLVGGGDCFEVGYGIRAETSKIQLRVVLDPPHGDLHRLPIACLGLGLSGFVAVTEDKCLQTG